MKPATTKQVRYPVGLRLSFPGSGSSFRAVKKLPKVILIAAAVLLVIAGIALLGVRSFVSSPMTRTRLEEELGNALRMPLTIGSVHLAHFNGIRIEGVSISGEGGNFLHGATLSARCRALPLLAGRLEIYALAAENPSFLWAPDVKGKWVLPRRVESAPSAPKETAPKPEKKRSFNVSIDDVRLTGGSLTLLGKERTPLVKFIGIAIAANSPTRESAAGTLTVDRIQWFALGFENVRTPFKYADGTLAAEALTASLAGGALEGTISTQPDVSGIPFAFALKLKSADLGRLMTETEWAPNQFAGKLDAQIDARGAFRRFSSRLEGSGSLALSGGVIQNFEFFQILADGLRIPELAKFRLNDSSAAFQVRDEKVQVDSLALNSADVKLLCKGPVRFNGKMDLDARLALSDRVADELPKFARENFLVRDASGQAGLEFKISGALSKPKTDLLQRISGRTLNSQLDNLTSSLFGGKKKNGDDKKKKESNESAPTLPPTPAAPAPEPPAPACEPGSQP
jgi:uncharacterized protein involved in outer membrane biogenesis